MLGFADIQIALVYILCIASMVVCVIYGIVNWNRDNGSRKKNEQGGKK